MLLSRLALGILPLVLCGSGLGAVADKKIAPREGVVLLVNAKNSHISIDAIDGERKGLKAHGIYELTPGQHTIRARLYFRRGNTEWSSNDFIDYAFSAEAGTVLNVVSEETTTSKGEGTWRMWIQDAASRLNIRSTASPEASLRDTKEHQRQLESNFADIRKKAEQGDLESEYELGLLYERGEGVAQSYSDSLKWYRKAGERGHATALFMLGLAFDTGQGVAQDPGEAFVWLSLAALFRDPSAPYFRDENEQVLSPAQLEKAKARLKVLEDEIRARKATS